MPRPQYHHRWLAAPIRLILGLALIAAAGAGCYHDSEPPKRFVPGDPLYDQYTSSGDRIVVEGPDGQGPALKIRERRRDTRVYGADMIYVGRVGIDDEGVVDQHRMTATTPRSVTEPDENTVVLDEAWRLERADAVGWDLFDDQRRLIALWRRDDRGHWTLRPTDQMESAYRVQDEGPRRQIVDGDDRVAMSVRASSWSDQKLLALSLETLEPLDRYALALWVDHHL